MKWNDYIKAFEAVLNGDNTASPYDKEAYLEYVKLNSSRQNRWLKKMDLDESTLSALNGITSPQTWILITEPWCGDAAHSTPFIQAMAENNPLIELDVQLRDSAPYLIDNYLTNGGKSIPKLIVRDSEDNDLFTWGPRPEECQALMLRQKESDMSEKEKKAELQMWYNKDKGKSVQREITALIEQFSETPA